MTRTKRFQVRSALFQAEQLIPKTRTQINERERDLIATANVAIWDRNVRKLASCLRRLTGSPERRETYRKIFAMLR